MWVIFQVKLKATYRQPLKHGTDKLWKNTDVTVYVKISVDHLAWPQRAIYAHYKLLKYFFRLILPGFCDFSGTWHLLFDSPKDLVFGEIWVFTNIFGFLGVNWPSKFTFDFTFKCNFGYIPLEPKWKVLKYSSTTAFLRLKTTLVKN